MKINLYLIFPSQIFSSILLRMEAIVNDAEIYKSILDAAKAHTQYTAVILIARKENNALKFLCREDDSFLFHCPLDPEKTIDEGISLVRDKICDTFEIDDTDIVNIAPFEYDTNIHG